MRRTYRERWERMFVLSVSETRKAGPGKDLLKWLEKKGIVSKDFFDRQVPRQVIADAIRTLAWGTSHRLQIVRYTFGNGKYFVEFGKNQYFTPRPRKPRKTL